MMMPVSLVAGKSSRFSNRNAGFSVMSSFGASVV